VEHPSEETLRRFVEGTAARDERRIVVAHLLKGCPACARKIRDFMKPAEVGCDLYDSALNRFDRGLVEGLESAISPVQTLRAVLGHPLTDGREPPRHRKPPHGED